MRASNAKPNSDSTERYQNLKLRESLCKPYQFSLSCEELSFILRNGYSKFPKNIQSLVFEETLFAFSLLPQIQMQSAISAANSLLQSAEFAFPKQKRLLAAKEFKHAVVASKRKSKANQEEGGFVMLPQDVTVHIFSFLDLQSLISTSAVCRSWNSASRDNHLWKSLYAGFFGKFENVSTQRGCNTGVPKDEVNMNSPKNIDDGGNIDWRSAFRTAYTDFCSRKFKSHRGYCLSCHSIVWLTSNKCSNKPNTGDISNHLIKPVSKQQIINYIIDGSLLSESSSDSESDNEDDYVFKLWAYPSRII